MIKKIFEYLFVFFVFGGLWFFANELFIKEWRAKKSEEQVKISIVENYKINKSSFKELIKYSQGLPAINELEFFKKGEIRCMLHSGESSITNLPSYFHSNELDQNHEENSFRILDNNECVVTMYDSTYQFKVWSWEFVGDQHTSGYDDILNHLKITHLQVDSLRALMQLANCEAITIAKDHSIRLRFDGSSFYQYEYLIPGQQSKIPEAYTQLDDNIACGLNDSDLFCGYYLFDK